jgi:Zn-dependent protease
MADWVDIGMRLLALIIAIPIHEYAHAQSAVSYGDYTPERDGRLTIFPWTHFDPIGGLMVVLSSIYGFGLGWGRPVRVRPEKFRHPRLDDVKCAAWGPFSNLLLAIGFAAPLRFHWIPETDPLYALFYTFVTVNLALMCFNLIPVYPLDGSHVVRGLLPTHLSIPYDDFMMRWGFWILFVLIFMGRGAVLGPLVALPAERVAGFLIGGLG